MLPDNRAKSVLIGFLSLAALLAAGCSSMSNSLSGAQSADTGQAFVIGTDAPAAAVVSFNVQIDSIEAVNSKTNASAALLSGKPVVDFARFNGLQTLLDVNDVAAGTYDSVVITLDQSSSDTIGYLDTSTTEPTVKTIPATLNNTKITIPLQSALVIAKSISMGLRVDFNLRQSIQTDSSGQINGQVNPTFNVKVVKPGDSGGHVDELVGGVVSVDQTNQQFVIQGPHGRQLTVKISGTTDWDDNSNLSELNTSTVVEISGVLDNAESTIDADEVAILTQDKFFASGQITYVTPASGAASSFDLYLRSLEPTNTGLTLGQLATVKLSGAENYYIYWMRNPMTQFLFNSSALVAGQDVAIGGPASGAADATNVTTKRVVLRPWGFVGTVVPGSINTAQGTFELKVDGFAGVLIPTPVTVFIGGATDYRDGLSAESDITASARIRIVGLLLKNPTSGQVVLLARHVDGLN